MIINKCNNNDPYINITDKTPFYLTLSISTKTVKTKEEGKKETEFFLKENILVNKTELTPFLTKHLHSTNLWDKKSNDIYSYCSQANYTGLTGIIIDYDNTMTIQQFKSLYSDYHFVLYPSTNHKLTKDSDGLEIEKFHVILPLDPNKYDIYKTPEMHARAYQ